MTRPENKMIGYCGYNCYMCAARSDDIDTRKSARANARIDQPNSRSSSTSCVKHERAFKPSKTLLTSRLQPRSGFSETSSTVNPLEKMSEATSRTTRLQTGSLLAAKSRSASFNRMPMDIFEVYLPAPRTPYVSEVSPRPLRTLSFLPFFLVEVTF